MLVLTGENGRKEYRVYLDKRKAHSAAGHFLSTWPASRRAREVIVVPLGQAGEAYEYQRGSRVEGAAG